MKADIKIYLEGGLQERLNVLRRRQGSPLKYKCKIADFYQLVAKEQKPLDYFFVFGEVDAEHYSQPLHIEAQDTLEFRIGCELHYGGCELNEEKLTAFKEIMDFLGKNKVACYLVASTADGEAVVVGYNPNNKKRIDQLK